MFTDVTIWLLATSLLGIFGLPLFNKIYNKDLTLINLFFKHPLFPNNKRFDFMVNFFIIKKLFYFKYIISSFINFNFIN